VLPVVADAVHRGLTKDPERRTRDVRTLLAEVQGHPAPVEAPVAAPAPVEAPQRPAAALIETIDSPHRGQPTPFGWDTAPPRRGRRRVWVAAAAAGAIAAAGVGAFFAGSSPAGSPEPRSASRMSPSVTPDVAPPATPIVPASVRSDAGAQPAVITVSGTDTESATGTRRRPPAGARRGPPAAPPQPTAPPANPVSGPPRYRLAPPATEEDFK
jgi:hypothetical protein